MARYLFRLEQMHVNFQRSAIDDFDGDLVVFGIQVGTTALAPLSAFIHRPIVSGSTVDFADFPPDNPRKQWEIGPIEVPDGGGISLLYSIYNVGGTQIPAISDGTSVKIAAASWSAMLGIGAALSAAAPPVALALAVAAGVVALAGEVIGDLLPSPTNCTGVVGANKIALTGTDLRNGTAKTGTMQATDTITNPDSPKGCGHPPETEVTYSITAVPMESVKQSLSGAGDLSKGLLSLRRSAGPGSSVRELIEAWSWKQRV